MLDDAAAADPAPEDGTATGGDALPWLRAAVARLTGLTPAEIDPGAGLIQLGIDSLMFLDLGERARRDLGVVIDAEAALGAETLADLAVLLDSRRGAA
jgi:yersiniabactin nonribosomal peptide/polyketide synthase